MRRHVLITVPELGDLTKIAEKFKFTGDFQYCECVELRTSASFERMPDYPTKKYEAWVRNGHLEALLLIQGSSGDEAHTPQGCSYKARRSIYAALQRRLDGRLQQGEYSFDIHNIADAIKKIMDWITDFKPRTFVQAVQQGAFDPMMKLSEAALMTGLSKGTIRNAGKGKLDRMVNSVGKVTSCNIRASVALNLQQRLCGISDPARSLVLHELNSATSANQP